MEGTELTEYLGETFRRLIGPPLTARELLALNRSEQGMYLVARLKLGRQPVLVDDNNRILAPLTDAVRTICSDLSSEQAVRVVGDLIHDRSGWIRTSDTHPPVTRKSDNVTYLLVAVLIYNEGGWIRIKGQEGVLRKTNAR